MLDNPLEVIFADPSIFTYLLLIRFHNPKSVKFSSILLDNFKDNINFRQYC